MMKGNTILCAPWTGRAELLLEVQLFWESISRCAGRV